jgi:pimeloyl-ACP methyl ester carboxylesterase
VQVPREKATVTRPTLVIWGLNDTALPEPLLEGLETYVQDLRIERVPGATHWIVHEQPEHVTALIGDFLAQRSA